MPRLLVCLPFAVLAAPVHAGSERATIAVRLVVEPSCRVRTITAAADRSLRVVVQCRQAPAGHEKPAYTMRTIRRPKEVLIAIDF